MPPLLLPLMALRLLEKVPLRESLPRACSGHGFPQVFFIELWLLWLLERKADIKNEKEILTLLQQKSWSICTRNGCTQFYYKDREETEALLETGVGSLSSKLSAYSSVRYFLLTPQRECYEEMLSSSQGGIGLIAEGRDCGSVVFPQCPPKGLSYSPREFKA